MAASRISISEPLVTKAETLAATIVQITSPSPNPECDVDDGNPGVRGRGLSTSDAIGVAALTPPLAPAKPTCHGSVFPCDKPTTGSSHVAAQHGFRMPTRRRYRVGCHTGAAVQRVHRLGTNRRGSQATE